MELLVEKAELPGDLQPLHTIKVWHSTSQEGYPWRSEWGIVL
jgi:hypothetical protein